MKKDIKDFENMHGGLKIKELEGQLANEKVKVEILASKHKKVTIQQTESNTIIFGLTGDRHIGSMYFDEEALKSFYDYAEKRGVTKIFDAGDMLDGHRVYKGQEFELRDLGMEKQLERISLASPNNIETEFITGNHDASFKNLAGAEIGREIEKRIPEYKFLGDTQARYKWETPDGNFELMLLHPGGGTAYALSYKPQKIVESLEGGSKPDLLAIGHFHKAECMPMYRNVCTVQTGTFQRQTPFMERGAIQAHVGGWIIEVIIGKTYKIIRPEFVAYYV